MEITLKVSRAFQDKFWGNVSLLSFILISISAYHYNVTICLFKNFIGSACIGCGLTGAVFSLFSFQLTDGLALNWRIILIAPLMVGIILGRIKNSKWLTY